MVTNLYSIILKYLTWVHLRDILYILKILPIIKYVFLKKVVSHLLYKNFLIQLENLLNWSFAFSYFSLPQFNDVKLIHNTLTMKIRSRTHCVSVTVLLLCPFISLYDMMQAGAYDMMQAGASFVSHCLFITHVFTSLLHICLFV